MRKIKEIMEAGVPPSLTDVQKGMLVTIFTSATPLQAFDTSNGSRNTVAARDELVRMGLAAKHGNELGLTDEGQQALINNNLVDETGELTEEGQTQLDNFETNKTELINLESFSLIKSLI